jgi:hypothetical protein
VSKEIDEEEEKKKRGEVGNEFFCYCLRIT